MNATKQICEVTKFTQEIEKLTTELERAYINEQVQLIQLREWQSKQE